MRLSWLQRHRRTGLNTTRIGCFLAVAAPTGFAFHSYNQSRLDKALVAAVRGANTRIVVSLLQRGANPNAKEEPAEPESRHRKFGALNRPGAPASAGNPVLSIAIVAPAGSQDPSPIVTALVAHGAATNAPGASGATPLILAVCADRPGTEALLLTHGALINRRDSAGRSALDYAILFHRPTTLAPLLEHGAESSAAANGVTPLSAARKEAATADRDQHAEALKVLQILEAHHKH